MMPLVVLNNSNANDIDPIDVNAVYLRANCMGQYTWAQLNAVTGGLSAPSKMPCYSFSISAKRCKVGAALRKVPGSTCASCYALKGRYVFPNVETAMERRYFAMKSNPVSWAAAMVASIRKTGMDYFRWHDSGDVQGMNHLAAIDTIAYLTPNVQHWLPTREYALIREWKRNGWTFQRNLVVRVSLPMVGRLDGASEWDNYSSVDIVPTDAVASECPSSTQGNKCADCRKCWDREVKCISYVKH